MSARTLILAAVAVAGLALAMVVASTLIGDDEPANRSWWVSAGAGAGGDGSQRRPFATIDRGLAAAGPGDRVVVGQGTYPPLVTTRSGTATAPIQVVAEGARIEGDGDGEVVEVVHNYVTIEGFDISRGDVLVRLVGATGSRVIGNRLHDAASECLRLRDGASENEVAGNRIERCGLRDFDLDADRKNGEGVYIGVAPEQLDDESMPDQSSRNWVHDNSFDVAAECVDVKEGASQNRVENNVCTGGQDPEGGGFSSRGDETVFRGNVSTGQVGAGIRLGGDDADQGVRNEVVGNQLTSTRGYALKVERFPQGLICGNRIGDNEVGPTNGDVDPSPPCPSVADPDGGGSG